MRQPTNEDYQWLYANTEYMSDGLKNARPFLLDIVERCPATFIDWGCGRGHLVNWIIDKTQGQPIGYDPASINAPCGVADWLLCFDVLEHIAEDGIHDTLKKMKTHCRLGMILSIANMTDVQNVDGELIDLHLTKQPQHWWECQLISALPPCTIMPRKINSDQFGFIVEFTND